MITDDPRKPLADTLPRTADPIRGGDATTRMPAAAAARTSLRTEPTSRSPRRAAAVVAILFAALLPATGWAGGLGRTISFTNLTAKEDEKAFYKDGGLGHAGKRVHIHVAASCIHEKPLRSHVTKSGVRYLIFKNKNVPIAARPHDVYLRKARQRTTAKDTLCIKGTVEKDGSANTSAYLIRVTRVTKAP